MKRHIRPNLCSLLVLAAGCTSGQSDVKLAWKERAEKKGGATEQDGKVSASIYANGDEPQILMASEGSAIAGASVTFPPGAIAIDTEVSIAAGPSLATVALLQSIGLGGAIEGAGAAVSVNALDETPTAIPFVISLPSPEGAALRADAAAAALFVIFEVNDGTSRRRGYFAREALKLAGGFVSFGTNFFGTYQAVLVRAAAKVAVPEPQPEVLPDAPTAVRYARGFLILTPADPEASADDETLAWAHVLSPGRIGGATTLTADYVVKPKKEP